MNNRYDIAVRPHQNKDLQGNNIVYTEVGGVYTSSLGNEPNYTWIDITDDASEFTSDITWDANNEINRQGDNGISSTITIVGKAYTYINKYLFKDCYAHIGTLDCRIIDNENGKELKYFIIKADGIRQVIDDGCVLELSIKEDNPNYDILSKADIFDNWQNWYFGESYPTTKNHPQFLVCKQKFGQGARLGLNLLWLAAPAVAFIAQIVGEDDRIVRRNLGLTNFMAAPLVRDIIQNVCSKCGYTIDTIFDITKDYENLCYASGSFSSFHKDESSAVQSPVLWMHNTSREPELFIDWLDDLCKVMACDWYIDGSVLKVRYLKDLYNDPVYYDFTINDTLYNVTLDYNGTRKNKRHGVRYATDDGASSQINVLYSDVTSYDQNNNNPTLDGNNVHDSKFFASTGFVRDGTVDDYIRDAIDDAEISAYINLLQLTVMTASVLGGVLTSTGAIISLAAIAWWLIQIPLTVDAWRQSYASITDTVYTGAIRLQNADELNVGRLLLWDGVDMFRAKVVEKFNPTINSVYNTLGYKANYSLDANPNSDSNNVNNNGVDYRAFNYPMYYDHKFTDNLAELHEPVYNPMYNFDSSVEVTFTVCKTPFLMDKFGLYIGQTTKLNKIVKIDAFKDCNNKVRITSIILSTSKNELIFKGKILRK
jgi:hypothetical protein